MLVWCWVMPCIRSDRGSGWFSLLYSQYLCWSPEAFKTCKLSNQRTPYVLHAAEEHGLVQAWLEATQRAWSDCVKYASRGINMRYKLAHRLHHQDVPGLCLTSSVSACFRFSHPTSSMVLLLRCEVTSAKHCKQAHLPCIATVVHAQDTS